MAVVLNRSINSDISEAVRRKKATQTEISLTTNGTNSTPLLFNEEGTSKQKLKSYSSAEVSTKYSF